MGGGGGRAEVQVEVVCAPHSIIAAHIFIYTCAGISHRDDLQSRSYDKTSKSVTEGSEESAHAHPLFHPTELHPTVEGTVAKYKKKGGQCATHAATRARFSSTHNGVFSPTTALV